MPKKILKTIKKPFTFLFEWRPYSPVRFLMYFFMFASVPMFYYGIKNYDFEIIKIIIFTIIVFYCGFFAVIIWNDICDVNIDYIVHPKRALPLGKITKKKFFIVALIFSIFVFIFSFLISLKCFLFIGLAALFVAIHNKYLRRLIKIPAYSEIITPLQWTIIPIFGFLSINMANYWYMLLLVIFTYFADAAHDLPEGIHDSKGDKKEGIRTYATSFDVKTAARISFIMLFFAGIIGMVLYIFTILSIIFLILFLIIWIYTIFYSFRYIMVKKKDLRKHGLSTGLKIYRFFWSTYVFIFIDLIIQIIKFQFFS